MIPIGHDRLVTRRLPIITISIIALNFLVLMVQAFVAPQQDTNLEMAFRKLIEFSVQHPQATLSPLAQQRLSQLPEWLVQSIKEEIQKERFDQSVDENEALPGNPLLFNDKPLIQAEMARLSTAFVQAYDGNWNQKFGFVPFLHKTSPVNYLSSIFMHGGWSHLIGNMLCLFMVGIALEDTWGALFFTVFYLLSGFVATVTHAFSSPDSKIVCVGASGAIAGLMGAFLVRHFKARLNVFVFVTVIKVPAYLYMPFMIAFDLRSSFRSSEGDVGGVAFWAHIGGFLFGAVACALVYYSGLEKLLTPKNTKPAKSFGTGNAVSEARSHLEQGEFDEAFRKLNQRIEAVPTDTEAQIVLAQAHAHSGNRDEEINTYHRIIKQSIVQKNMPAALNAYSLLLDSYGQDETPHALPGRDWLAICDHLRAQGMFREASGEYEKVARAYVGEWFTAQALVGAAECRTHLMEYEYARDLYKLAYDYAISNPNLQMKIAEELVQVENVLRVRNAA